MWILDNWTSIGLMIILIHALCYIPYLVFAKKQPVITGWLTEAWSAIALVLCSAIMGPLMIIVVALSWHKVLNKGS